MKKENAFTLAEVLITLGIIGIVAAMTLPTLITDARKKSTATKVKKFYNIINNAVQFSIAKNGDVENWMGEARIYTYEENVQFVKDYFLPYIKYRKYEKCNENLSQDVCVYLIPDGMFSFTYDGNGADIVYYIDGEYIISDEEITTHNYFGFQFNKKNGNNEDGIPIERDFNRKTSVEPYTFNWDGTYENLKTHPRYGCNKNSKYKSFCTKLLQMNNWEITDDYPW